MSIRRRFISTVRFFLAEVFEQILYYVAIFLAIVTWIYFSSIYIGVIVGLAGLGLAWVISYIVQGEEKS